LLMETTSRTPPSGTWSLSSSFQGLERTYFGKYKPPKQSLQPFFTFKAIGFTIDSTKAEKDKLRFSGELNLTGNLGLFALLLYGSAGKKKPAISGNITINRGKIQAGADTAVPEMILKAKTPDSIPPLGNFTLDKLQFQLESTAYVNVHGIPLPRTRLAIKAHADIDNIRKQMNLTASYTPGSGDISFTGNFKGDSSLTVSDLIALAGTEEILNTLPERFPFIDTFGLNSFSVTANRKKLKGRYTLNVSSLSIAVAPGDANFQWEILPGILAVKTVKAYFTIAGISGNMQLYATLAGEINLEIGAGIILEVTGTYPGYIFTAALEPKTAKQPALKDLIKSPAAAGLEPPPGGESVKIEFLKLTVDAKHKTYALQAFIAGGLGFEIAEVSFALKGVLFELTYVGGKIRGSVSGSFDIKSDQNNNFTVYLSAGYENKTWTFTGGLDTGKKPLLLSHIFGTYGIGLYLHKLGSQFTISRVALSMSSGNGNSSYSFHITAGWKMQVLNRTFDGVTDVLVSRDSTGVSGSVAGRIDFSGIEVGVEVDFSKKELIYKLSIDIDVELAITAQYTSSDKSVTFSLENVNLGRLLTFLFKTAMPNLDVTMPKPWDLLNHIDLSGTHFTIGLEDKSFSVEKDNLDLNLVFASIKKITLTYIPKKGKKSAQVYIEVTASLFHSGSSWHKSWDLLEPAGYPPVPGKTGIFDLKFLGVGQHVSPNTGTMNTVTEAIHQLATVFSRQGDMDPARPVKGTQLKYDGSSHWLIGADFILVNTFEVGFIFNDPKLYGLLIGVKNTPEAKPLGGLHFEIMYKKINDTTGMYFIYLKLPDSIRRFKMGEVTVILPSIKVWVYTDGSFKVDLGFPEHNNFSESFGLEVFPFTGAGGFYFGVLHGQDTGNLPAATNGTFNPVVQFGIGLQVGLGKDIDRGMLKAGISLTVVGIVQGIFAMFHPTKGGDAGKALYYSVQGQLAIVGKIYGTVNFAIISATVDVTATIDVRATIASHEPIVLNFNAEVKVSLTVKIKVVFTIHIHLSFHARITESFTIGSHSTPPWQNAPLPGENSDMIAGGYPGLTRFTPAVPVMNWDPAPLDKENLTEISLLFSPHFTASSVKNHEGVYTQKARGVAALCIDSHKQESSFDKLAELVFKWVIGTYLTNNKEADGQLDEPALTPADLRAIAAHFHQNTALPFTYRELKAFLAANIKITLRQPGDLDPSTAKDIKWAAFPMLPPLTLWAQKLIFPDIYIPVLPFVQFEGDDAKTRYTAVQINKIFQYYRSLSVRYQNAADTGTGTGKLLKEAGNNKTALPELIFADYFAMIAKEALHRSIDLMNQVNLTLQPDQKLSTLAKGFGLTTNAQLQALVYANRTVELDKNLTIRVNDVSYTIKNKDIAKTFEKTCKNIVENNPFGDLTAAKIEKAYPNIKTVTAGHILALPEFSITVPDKPPNTLSGIAGRYGIEVKKLIAHQDPPVTHRENPYDAFFAPGTRIVIPNLQRITISGLLAQLRQNYAWEHISGMTSRFLLHGLRVPPPKGNNTIDTQNLHGLYELTGQQFDTTGFGETTFIMLTHSTTEPAPKLSITFDSPKDALAYQITKKDLATIDNMQKATFNPALFEARGAAMSHKGLKRFPLGNKITWKTLDNITKAPHTFNPPTLWKIPHHLQMLLNHVKYPESAFELFHQTQQSAATMHKPQKITHTAPAALVDITLRRVPIHKDKNKYLPNVYEIHGIEADAIKLLEKIITAGNETLKKSHLRLAYPDQPVREGKLTPKSLVSESDDDVHMFLLQTNQSTVSHPSSPIQTLTSRAVTGSPFPGNLVGMDNIDFVSHLWEAGVVNTGGYYLYYRVGGKESKKGLPDHLFSEKAEDAKITMIIDYPGYPDGTLELQGYTNCIIIQEQVNLQDQSLFLAPGFLVRPGNYVFLNKVPTAPPGSVGFEVEGENPEELLKSGKIKEAGNDLQELFHLIQYQIVGDENFNAGSLGLPAGPAEANSVSHYTNDWKSPVAPNLTHPPSRNYSKMISAYPYSRNMPKPKPIDSNQPDPRRNPYLANGSNAQIALYWLDIYGNQINPPKKPGKTIKNLFIGYTDDVIAVSAWPSVATRYLVEGKPGNAQLSYMLMFNPMGSLPEAEPQLPGTAGNAPQTSLWTHRALNHLQKFKEIYYQLNRPDVNVYVASSLEYPDIAAPGHFRVKGKKITDRKKKVAMFAGTIFTYLQYLGKADYKILQKELSGESALKDIAALYGIPVPEFYIFNQGITGNIDKNAELAIPVKSIKTKKKQSLHHLAASNHIKVDVLLKLNPSLSPGAEVDPGITVFFPLNGPFTQPDPTVKSYTLTNKKDLPVIDTAHSFGISAEVLYSFNHTLYMDMKIQGPTRVNVPVKSYKVKEKEPLKTLAAQFKTTEEVLKALNSGITDPVLADTTVIIPVTSVYGFMQVPVTAPCLPEKIAGDCGVSAAMLKAFNPNAGAVLQNISAVYIPVGSYTLFKAAKPADIAPTINVDISVLEKLNPNIDVHRTLPAGTSLTVPVPQPLSITRPVSNANKTSIFELTVKMQIQRSTTANIHPDFQDVNSVKYGVSTVNPDYRVDSTSNPGIIRQPLTLRNFARKLEGAFEDKKLKVAVGTADPHTTGSKYKEIWIVNFNPTPGENGISYSVTPNPGYTLTPDSLERLKAAPYQIDTQTLKSLGKLFLWHNYDSADALVADAAKKIEAVRTHKTYQAAIKETAIYQPRYCAVPPLFNRLISSRKDIPIKLYDYKKRTFINKNPKPIGTKFTNIDLESLAKQFLAAVDDFLLPEYSIPAWRMENPSETISETISETGVPSAKPCADIIGNKADLARSIAGRLEPVFGKTGDKVPKEAREKLRQELLIRLSNLYAFDTVVQVPVKSAFSGKKPGNLFGKLMGTALEPTVQGGPGTRHKDPGFSMSTAKIALNGREDNTYLTFLFSVKDKKSHSFFPVDVQYKINALEYEIDPVRVGKATYPDSSWLTLVIPFEESDDPLRLEIPVPLHAFPTAPTMGAHGYCAMMHQFGDKKGKLLCPKSIPEEHHWAEHHGTGGEPPGSPDSHNALAETKRWQYNYTYKYRQAEQDTVKIGIDLDTPPSNGGGNFEKEDSGLDLFEALVQFAFAYPKIKKDMDDTLLKNDLTHALPAVQSLAWLIERVRKTWPDWDKHKGKYDKPVVGQDQYEFNMIEYQGDEGKEKKYTINIIPVATAQERDITSKPAVNTPCIEIPGFKTHGTYDHGTGSRTMTFTYLSPHKTSWLSFSDGIKIAERSVVFYTSTFDILRTENARGKISISRNKILGGRTKIG
ncbi:MAG: LysM peptidoglycan-binding domain-containing protein, partial [bacterium]|nr:LysM peptidoglycan-binding domain-containing protein [bacterium]